jgi:peptidyl-prolyl cis-trans isomerase B (cyclophilin B)
MGRTATAVLLTLLLLGTPSAAAQEEDHWSDNEVDPDTWTDGPVQEGSPMDNSTPGNPLVLFRVSYTPDLGASEIEGEIVIELFPQWVPITAGNFIGLAETSFWDGIFFHRVIDDFVAQSGDPSCTTIGIYPTSSPSCGEGGSGETIPLEHHDNMSHVDGAIGMARGLDPDSAESQFYIADGPQHGLDPENRQDEGYATFGVVRDGMSHIYAIAAVPTSNDPLGGTLRVPPGPDRPVDEVHIISISMLGVVAGSVEEDENSSGIMAQAEAAAIWMIDPIMWVWALAMLAGVGISVWKDGVPRLGQAESEAALDALLEPSSTDEEENPVE